ncbi:uncharacterized protein LOC121372368 [Gigantopelta aegis]|uniref:uncharacterized protein LOC121372368 n=1 Tax=Gigantopelta aegis TaxID=1735272 RepID=UPI001B888A77|nr:uncharacterized protein LOC121372368 [Gigantopelta aegis]
MDRVAYQKKVSDYFSAACVEMALQLARNTGILDVLFSAEQPLTSVEIAEQGKLKERYVREILGALAVSEIIQVDDTSTKFHVPNHHKKVLQTLAVIGKAAPIIGSRMEVMTDIVSKDGPAGIPFGEPEFNWLKETKMLTQDAFIDGDLLGCLPEIKSQLEQGIHVCEFGCANGIVLLNLAARYPKSTFVGSDISKSSLDQAQNVAVERGLGNIKFEVHDLTDLPDAINNSFDWVFLQDTLHDLPSPGKAMQGVKRSLKKGATASFVDLGMQGKLADNRGNLFWAQMYTFGSFFCVPGSLVQSKDAEAFGPCWGVEKTRQLINEAGLSVVKEDFSRRSPGFVHYVCKCGVNKVGVDSELAKVTTSKI